MEEEDVYESDVSFYAEADLNDETAEDKCEDKDPFNKGSTD